MTQISQINGKGKGAWRFLLALLLLAAPLARAQVTQTMGSTASAPRADSSSNYVDWWLVRAAPTTLVSIYGYNSGAQQFLQLFDSPSSPTVSVTAWDATADTFTAVNHGLSVGQRVQLTGTVAGIAAGIYYVGYNTNNTATNNAITNVFSIYDTLAHARAGAATGMQDVTGGTSTATLNRLPVHVQAIAGADNFYAIVPNTGLSFGKGLVVALSTTGPTYTASTKVATFTVTFRQP